MPILEEEVREQDQGLTEAELAEEMAEVRQAEDAETLLREAYGGGLDQQTLLRYDQMAHHMSRAIQPKKLAEAERHVVAHWDPLHEEMRNDFTALAGLESIKKQVIAPVLSHKTAEARQELGYRATDLLRDAVATEGQTREQVKETFCGTISKDVTGAEYHPVAVEIYEQLIEPVAKDPEPVSVVEEEQQGKAEEQIEEEEEKQSA